MAWIGTGLAVGGTILSNMGSKTPTKTSDTGTSTVNQGPWDKQAPYIETAFQRADNNWTNQNDAFNSMQSMGVPQNAAANDWQLGSANALANYAQGQMGNPNALAGAYSDIAARENGQYDAFANMSQDLYSRGMGDVTAGAEQVANSQYMNNAVDSAWGNAKKWFDIEKGGQGGIDHTMSRNGNLNSSRAGVAEGLAQAEGMRQGMQAENDIRYNAYNTGINASLQERGLDQDIAAGLRTGPSYAEVNGLNANDARMTNLAQMQQTAGDNQQRYEQTNNDNLYNAYAFTTGDPWSNLQNYYGIVGANNWGQSGTTQETGSRAVSGGGSTTGQAVGAGINAGLNFLTKKQ